MQSIQLRDARLQQLVEQMVQGGERLDADDIEALVDAAYTDDERLSGAERQSLRELLLHYSDHIESPEARAKLEAFGQMTNATLRDAAHCFARDGAVTQEEARELQNLAMRDGRISRREKITLKALLGYYAPQMEPGAQ